MKFWQAAAVTAALTDGPASASDGAPPQVGNAVVDTMQQMFMAFAADDEAELGRLTTDDFRVFERGQYMSLAQLLAGLRELRQKQVAYEWVVTAPRLQVHRDFATIAYINQGAITTNGLRAPTTWYESGTLRLVDDRWRVMLVQSEKVRPDEAAAH
ncbi:nuclear transport factor 2 family protein [Lichenicoccus sp.]|uniref:nuclear transport factor 2 family protein n=1 Tax=Lichenicoccus sp. TaxID=2781899 RepID=UPI003D11053B